MGWGQRLSVSEELARPGPRAGTLTLTEYRMATERDSRWERRTWPGLARLAREVPEAGIHFQSNNTLSPSKHVESCQEKLTKLQRPASFIGRQTSSLAASTVSKTRVERHSSTRSRGSGSSCLTFESLALQKHSVTVSKADMNLRRFASTQGCICSGW